jgi:hypothetical protein
MAGCQTEYYFSTGCPNPSENTFYSKSFRMSVRYSSRIPWRTKPFQALYKARSFDLPLFNFAVAETEVSFTDYLPGMLFPSGSPVCPKTLLNCEVQDSGKASNNKLSFASTSALSDGRSEDLDDFDSGPAKYLHRLRISLSCLLSLT